MRIPSVLKFGLSKTVSLERRIYRLVDLGFRNQFALSVIWPSFHSNEISHAPEI